MSVYDAMFDHYKTYQATILSKSQPLLSNGTRGALAWIPGKTFTCLYWHSSATHVIFNATFRTDVVASLIARPEEIDVTDFPGECRVRVWDDKADIEPIQGFINNAAGYAIGATTINVDSFTDKLMPIKAGDNFLLAPAVGDQDDATLYEIISVARSNTTGNATSFTFTPPLTVARLDNDIIDLFHKKVAGEFLVTFPEDVSGQGQVIYIPLKASDA